MAENKISTNENKHVLGSELRDAIARIITRVQPNVQFEVLTRLVDEFEVEIKGLHETQEQE